MRSIILLTVVLFAGTIAAEDWHTLRAKSALAMAHADEEKDQSDKIVDDKCPDCYGTGKRGDGRFVVACPTCKGTGKRKAGSEAPVFRSPAGEASISGDAGSSEIIPESDPDIYGLRFTAPWCSFCRKFEDEEESKVGLKLKAIDTNTAEGKKIAEAAGVTNLPVILICDTTLSTVLARIDGFATGEKVNSEIDRAKLEKESRRKRNENLLKSASVRIVANGNTHGSGTVIKSDGKTSWILTATHAVSSGEIFVEPVNAKKGSRYRARVLRSNDVQDIAIISIESPKLDALEDVGNLTQCGILALQSSFPEGGEFKQNAVPVRERIQIEDVSYLATDDSALAGSSGGSLTVEGTIVGVISATSYDGHFTLYGDGDSIRALKREVFSSVVAAGSQMSLRDRIRKAYPSGALIYNEVNPRSRVQPHLISEHGYTKEQLAGMNQWDMLCLHDATHRGLEY